MKITEREDNQLRINLDFDKKRYKQFISEVAILGKKYESESDIKNLKYTLVVNGVKTPDMETGGWSNRCEDFKFIIFLDFDNALFWQVKTQLEFLMERFDLSPFYVFETQAGSGSKVDCNGDEYGSYNCVCLTKKRFFEVFEIQNETTCDQAHKNLPKIYRFASHILRNKPKGSKGAPVFKTIIGDLDKEYNQKISSAHLNFLESVHEVPKIKYTNPDGYSTLWLADYKTASK